MKDKPPPKLTIIKGEGTNPLYKPIIPMELCDWIRSLPDKRQLVVHHYESLTVVEDTVLNECYLIEPAAPPDEAS